MKLWAVTVHRALLLLPCARKQQRVYCCCRAPHPPARRNPHLLQLRKGGRDARIGRRALVVAALQRGQAAVDQVAVVLGSRRQGEAEGGAGRAVGREGRACCNGDISAQDYRRLRGPGRYDQYRSPSPAAFRAAPRAKQSRAAPPRPQPGARAEGQQRRRQRSAACLGAGANGGASNRCRRSVGTHSSGNGSHSSGSRQHMPWLRAAAAGTAQGLHCSLQRACTCASSRLSASRDWRSSASRPSSRSTCVRSQEAEWKW